VLGSVPHCSRVFQHSQVSLVIKGMGKRLCILIVETDEAFERRNHFYYTKMQKKSKRVVNILYSAKASEH
jgi:hypothetical protein